jgi:predicted phage tail protein
MFKAYLGIMVLFSLSFSVPAGAQTNACDVNGDGVVNVLDVQLVTDMDLGLDPCTADIAGSGVCTAQVVQTVINTALGGTCSLHYVALNWTASTSPSIAGYNVYRSTTSGGSYTKLNSSLIASTSFTDTTVQAGQTYYYVATAVNTSSVESAYSTPISALVPTP